MGRSEDLVASFWLVGIGVIGGSVRGPEVSVVSGSDLSEITVVVSLHLEVEHLGLSSSSLWDEELVEQVENVLADVAELLLDLLAVFLSHLLLLLRSLGLLLNGRDDSPR
ncbi:hypothetical protein GCK72_023811 [Caenorhabditis remanei]|uniref:Uncharacterized protein n=1 Tax=Caenorhabditis remanei TaxID=31234 RepID=A0A6A5FYA7_CAERE|nr:hypothetical protein GCK72_023811 [Caenorhabditis remanei]KAF1747349.1 hypothetical protein GCK72_023811 [Caenorhabditis remanei]